MSSSARFPRPVQNSSTKDHASVSAVHPSNGPYHQQVDGSAKYYPHTMPANSRSGLGQPAPQRNTQGRQYQGHHRHKAPAATASHVAPRHQNRIPENAVTDLLPYCTTGPPLRQEQIIALSNIVGSLKELVLLARGAAAGDAGCGDKLVDAVGVETASNIVGFFVDEWEVE